MKNKTYKIEILENKEELLETIEVNAPDEQLALSCALQEAFDNERYDGLCLSARVKK